MLEPMLNAIFMACFLVTISLSTNCFEILLAFYAIRIWEILGKVAWYGCKDATNVGAGVSWDIIREILTKWVEEHLYCICLV